MPFPVDGRAGINLSATYQSIGVAPFSLGMTTRLSDGGLAMFVCSSTSAVSTFAAVNVTSNFKVNMLTTTNAANSKQIAFAGANSIATGACGWVQFGGRPKVNLAANCAPNVVLYTTSTAGVLDDATVSGGAVWGATQKGTISNATASTLIAASVCVIGTGATPSV